MNWKHNPHSQLILPVLLGAAIFVATVWKLAIYIQSVL